ELDQYFRRASTRQARGEEAPLSELPLMELADRQPPVVISEITGAYMESVRILGRRAAEFHLALAGDKKNPDFKPERSSRIYTEQLSETLSREVQGSLALLAAKITELPDAVHRQADRVLLQGPSLLGRISDLAGIGEDLGQLIRHHGDYHLGQVLRTIDNDFILLDFEGEPLRPLVDRRRKGSPLKDVAGMIRSFHYAIHSDLPTSAEGDGEGPQLPGWRRAWYESMSAVFVREYFATAGEAPFLPAAGTGLILESFLLEKVFYELKYELNNRPDWVTIPLAGILDIIDRQKPAGE
ncbi:MAG: hypothetical protein P1P81_07795, partial [Desulfobulbales bacterium]|nr:hypothetical protein [Desulfobulbales bacterium]